MGFRQGAYARVFSAEDKGKYSVCRMTISRKNKETDRYETDWTDGFVRFVGKAHETISGLDIPDKKGVSVRLVSCDVTNNYDADKKKTYTNYVVFEVELPDDNSGKSSGASNNAKANSAPPATMDDDDPQLPF